MQRITILFVLLGLTFVSEAQKISGSIRTAKGESLAFASVMVKGTTIGVSANDKGNYQISLQPGKYTIVCQHIGYSTSEKSVNVSGEEKLDFVLTEQNYSLQEVVVSSNAEDPAYAIIRNAIKKRTQYAAEVKNFTCDLYGKDIIKLRSVPKSIFGQKIKAEDKQGMGVDSAGKGIIYLSENISNISRELPNKLKLEVKSSRISGSNGFGFTFPVFISMYQNNVQIFSEKFNPRGFVSPIADGALGFYKYKFLGSFFEDGKEINKIKVTPRRKYEPLFSGIIQIVENDWRIHSFDLMLTKESQLEIMDTLRVSQLHVPVEGGKWPVKNQLLSFSAKLFGFDVTGNFLNVFSNYNLNPQFGKKYFDKVVMTYDTGVNKRPVAYWDSIRPMPLEPEEVLDYKVKDSTNKANMDSSRSRFSLDSMNKRQPKLRSMNFVMGGYSRAHYTKSGSTIWGFEPLVTNLEYNNAEGLVANAEMFFSSRKNNGKGNFRIEPTLRYGFGNNHLNAFAHVYAMKNWVLSGGKRVSEFNKESTLSPLVNSFSILFYGKNYIKTYENYYGLIGYNRKWENGWNLHVHSLYEDRIPLNNINTYSFKADNEKYVTPNYPVELMMAQFARHQAAEVQAEVSYQPGQRFIQYPRRKVSIGSNAPVFTFQYTKGIKNILGSDVDFDKWKFMVTGNKNLKMFGNFKYRIGAGGFLNDNAVEVQDYQHFNGNRTIAAGEYLNTFQLAGYYSNSTTAKLFGFGHAEHHFNGLITNKIPVFRKLNWHLVAGSNAFYVNDKNNYVELSVGIENILKVLRVDFVAAYQNGSQGITGIRIGAGGLLGGNMKMDGLGKRLNGNYHGKRPPFSRGDVVLSF